MDWHRNGGPAEPNCFEPVRTAPLERIRQPFTALLYLLCLGCLALSALTILLLFVSLAVSLVTG